MSTTIPMSVVMGQLLNACYQNEQQRANGFANALSVDFPATATVLNYGSPTPDVDQQQFPWFRLNSDGTPDALYSYYNGNWVRAHPVPPQDAGLVFYNDSLSNLALYQGGEGNYVTAIDGTITPTIPITATTGPMWQVNVAMQGMFPLGVANTSVASQIKDAYGNVINAFIQGQSGGEIQHTLTTPELAPHSHLYDESGQTSGDSIASGHGFGGSSKPTSTTGGDTINGVSNVPVGHQNMPPYFVGYWIQRTARVFYRL